MLVSPLPFPSPLARGPGVSSGWLVTRGFSPLLFDRLSLACFSVVLCLFFTGDPRLRVCILSFFHSSSPRLGPLSLADACAPSVCRLSVFFCGVAACCLFVLFTRCWCCCVLCVVLLVVGVRGGFFLCLLVTACLTCECHAERCRCSLHPPCRSFFSLSRPLVLLLVVGPGFVIILMNRFLVGLACSSLVLWRVCLCLCACACLRVFAQLVRPPWKHLWPQALGLFSLLLLVPSPDLMADAPAVRRRRVRGEDGEQHRAVHARVDEAETRLDSLEAALQRHETRIQFVEAPFRLVLRGFRCVPEFLRLLRSNDLRAAKTAFIPSFVDELKEQSGPEVAHLIEESENLLVDRQGWVLLGVFPTGGHFNDVPDGLLRLQPSYAGSRLSHILAQASRYPSSLPRPGAPPTTRWQGRREGQRQGQTCWRQRQGREG